MDQDTLNPPINTTGRSVEGWVLEEAFIKWLSPAGSVKPNTAQYWAGFTILLTTLFDGAVERWAQGSVLGMCHGLSSWMLKMLSKGGEGT